MNVSFVMENRVISFGKSYFLTHAHEQNSICAQQGGLARYMLGNTNDIHGGNMASPGRVNSARQGNE